MVGNCLNIRSQEFKDAVEKTGEDPVALAAAITEWQDKNNSNDYPLFSNIPLRNLGGNSSIKSELFNRSQDAESLRDVYNSFIDVELATVTRTSKGDYRLTVTKNPNPIIGKPPIKQSGQLSLFEEIGFNKNNSVPNIIARSAFEEIADKLSEKTGINYDIVPAAEMVEILKEISPDEKFTESTVPLGVYYKEQVYFTEELLNRETAFHEFSHPFIDAIYKTNKNLFNNLLKQLENSKEGRAIIAYVNKEYANSSDLSKKKEYIVTALGKLADGTITLEKDRSLYLSLKALLKRISEYLANAFADASVTIDTFELEADTTLQELVKVLKVDNKILVKSEDLLSAENERMKLYGITRNQSKNRIPLLNQLLYKTITPATYNARRIVSQIPFALFVGRSYEDFMSTLEKWKQEDPTSVPDWFSSITKEQYNKREDAWRLSNGLRQIHDTFKYVGRGKIGPDLQFYEDIDGEDIYDFNDPQFGDDLDKSIKREFSQDNTNFVMGQYALAIGKDEKGHYIQYTDRWDLNMSNKLIQKLIDATQKPFIVSGKLYRALTYDPAGQPITYYTTDYTHPDVAFYNNFIEEIDKSEEVFATEEPQFSRQASKDEDINKLANKVKLYLEKQYKILKKKHLPGQKLKESRLENLLSNIKALQGIESITAFIEDAYDQTGTAEEELEKLLENKENLTRHELITKLSAFNEFANGYSILDEISKENIEELRISVKKRRESGGEDNIATKLLKAIESKRLIQETYLSEGIPLLADYLLESKSESLTEAARAEIKVAEDRLEEKKKNKTLSAKTKAKDIKDLEERIAKLRGYDLDKDTLIKQLKLASSDEGAIDFLFSPLISSSDSVLALFAKSVKNQLEDARLKSIKLAEEVQKEYKDFEANNSKNKDNVAEFNSDLYEVIEVFSQLDEQGKRTFTPQKAFVQKYDVTEYQRSMNKMFDRIGPKPLDPESAEYRAWQKVVGKWFNENTAPKEQDEINKIIADKKKELSLGIITQEDYDEWTLSVMSEYEGEITYKRDLARPSDKYLNKKWTNLYDSNDKPKNAAGRYHAYLVKNYFEKQEELPVSFRKGYVLPSIQKDNLERSLTQGIIETGKKRVKEALTRQEYDTEYGLAGLEGKDAKFLPVYFTQLMDADDVSSDVTQALLVFSAMADRYKALNNINGEIALTKTVVGQREVIQTNSKGQQILDAFAKKYGYEEYVRQNGESYSSKHLDAFIDMIVYGEMQKQEELSLMGITIDAGKLTNTITGFSAVTTLAVDLLKGTANNIQGNIQVMIEANSGEFFNKTNVKNGKAFYFKSVGQMMSDFGKMAPESLPSKLVDLFDAIQGEFVDNFGKNVTGSAARKLFRSNTLFFNQHVAEHEIQVSTMFALLDATKVIDNATNKEISLLEAYQKYGVDGVTSNTNFTEAKRKEVMNRLHAINKRLHGVYNSFDKGTAQRYSLGRLAMMYRKYLIPAYKRRWKSISGDQELGGITEGYYRTFWNTFAKDLIALKFNIFENWSSYSDFEKAQIKRTSAEAAFILSLTILASVLKSMGDDDEELKNNYAYNFLLYQATRQRSETSSYISPKDAYRVVKSPSAITTSLDRTIKLVDQLLFTWDPDKLQYKRKSGIWNKGDNKSWAAFVKLAGISGYNLNPEEAVKSFEGTLNK